MVSLLSDRYTVKVKNCLWAETHEERSGGEGRKMYNRHLLGSLIRTATVTAVIFMTFLAGPLTQPSNVALSGGSFSSEVPAPHISDEALALEEGALPSGGNAASNASKPSTEDQKLDAQTGDPLVDLLDGNVPLGGLGHSNVWSLLNLILAIAAVVSMLCMIVIIVFRSRAARIAAQYGVAESTDTKASGASGVILRILGVVTGLLPLALFAVVEDFSRPMVFIDQTSLLIGLLFVIHIVFLVINLRGGRKKASAAT